MYCGIDVSKRKHVALLMNEAGEVTQRAFSLDNSRAGFDQLLQVLVAQPEPVMIGLEATGHYWVALYDTLTHAGYPVVVLNPLQVHAYQRTGLRKCKNDRVDAFWIADFVRISRRPAATAQTPVLLQLRELSRFRYRLSEQIGQCKQKILNVLDRVFPEYEKIFSKVFVQSSRQLLAQAVSAHQFADFDLNELAQILRKASRGRFGKDKAEEIQTAACQSIGVSFLTDAVHIEVRCLLDQIELLETQQQDLDAVITTLMDQLPTYLTTIPGIGPVTGAAILGEIGEIERFDSLEKLVAYAGINPTVFQSGQFEATESHLSKRGSPYLRHALWQSALVAYQHDPDLQAFYDRKKAEGKHHNVILGAICRKLLARIYIVQKERRPYVVQ